jgi:hypothetical protein
VQVNSFVHPAERIPGKIRQADIAAWQADYEISTNLNIGDYLREFDELLVEVAGDYTTEHNNRVARF